MGVRHLVLFRFKPTVSAADAEAVVRHFAELPGQIPGITSFECGINSSPEGLAKGFTHPFLMSFESAAARDAYLPHPAHQAFVQRIGPLVDDVLVIDYEPRSL